MRSSFWLSVGRVLPVLVALAGGVEAQSVFINELHYDNDGADADEAVEIAGPAGLDLAGWSIALYNGSPTQLSVYDTFALSGTLPDQVNGCGTLAFPRAGIQNGSPDGLALVDSTGALVQFLSYEGSFTAANGPAAGVASTDIGVEEIATTPIGFSLQLSGTGTTAPDFTWNPPGPATFGSPNTGQSFGPLCESGPPPPPPTVTKIHDIQGSGPNVVAGAFIVDAVVVGDFQADNELRGFFIQEEDADADADPATSEGLFVFCSGCSVPVAVGDLVRVTGSSSDFFGMSQLTATGPNDVAVLGTAALPTPSPISLPVPVTTTSDLSAARAEIDAFFEPYEGMLVTFPQTLSVAEYFELSRYGQIILSEGGRPRQFTDESAPSATGFVAQQIDVATRRIILDDEDNTQNSALVNGVPVFHPQPGFSITNFVRGGDTIEDLTGVLHWSFAGQSGTDAWRVRPVVEAFSYPFERTNPREPAPPDVGGTLRVASFNVLNYFTSLDLGVDDCGPSGGQECRGADSAAELERQTAKIVAALCAIDADIVGLIEIENDVGASVEALVAALGAAGCGTYDLVDTGTTGTDAIKVALIYRPERVSLFGPAAVLDTAGFLDPNNLGTQQNRPAVAQGFTELATGEQLTVAVNHLKSKGSGCGPGDDDTTTGQGNCNVTRTLAAAAEAAWLASDPTGTGSGNVLVLGDLNAYRNEDPVVAFESGGYIDLLDAFIGPEAYTYVFDGQLGYLDYALASAALAPKVTGVTAWHIDADEVNLLDYNDTVQDPSEASFEAKPAALPLYAPDAFRASDHDPVIVGLDLGAGRPPGRILLRVLGNQALVRWRNLGMGSGLERIQRINGAERADGQVLHLRAENGLLRGALGLGVEGSTCADPQEDAGSARQRVNCDEALVVELDPSAWAARRGEVALRAQRRVPTEALVTVYRNGVEVGSVGITVDGTTKAPIDFGVDFDALRFEAETGAFALAKLDLLTR